jgi:hypothetical protein
VVVGRGEEGDERIHRLIKYPLSPSIETLHFIIIILIIMIIVTIKRQFSRFDSLLETVDRFLISYFLLSSYQKENH